LIFTKGQLFHFWINVIIYLMDKCLLIGSIDIYLSDKLLYSLSEGGATGPKYCINKLNKIHLIVIVRFLFSVYVSLIDNDIDSSFSGILVSYLAR